jgi:hypothetical protein
MTALRDLESAEQVAKRRGLSVPRLYGLPDRPRRAAAAPPVAEPTAATEGGV